MHLAVLRERKGIVIYSRQQSTFSGHHEAIPGSWETVEDNNLMYSFSPGQLITLCFDFSITVGNYELGMDLGFLLSWRGKIVLQVLIYELTSSHGSDYYLYSPLEILSTMSLDKIVCL